MSNDPKHSTKMNTFSPDSNRGSDESGDYYSLCDFIFFLFPSLLVVLMFVVIVLRHVMSVAWFLLLQKLRPTDINSLKECCKITNNLLGKGTVPTEMFIGAHSKISQLQLNKLNKCNNRNNMES